MKTLVVQIMLFALLNGSLAAQTGKFRFSDSNIKLVPGINNFQIDTNFKLIPWNDTLSLKKKFKFNLGHDTISFDRINPAQSPIAEEFPGASRYYAKLGDYIFITEKSFIKKPDTTSKQYLIIKNPLSHHISR
jgi:hypothetical protein